MDAHHPSQNRWTYYLHHFGCTPTYYYHTCPNMVLCTMTRRREHLSKQFLLRPVCLAAIALLVLCSSPFFNPRPSSNRDNASNTSSRQVSFSSSASSSFTVQPQVEAPYESPLPTSLTCQSATTTDNNAMHVLFGLSGDDPGFLAEFQVALKSVLLNAPLDSALTIHIVADRADAVQSALEQQTGVSHWQTRQAISIRIYRVGAATLDQWTAQIEKTLGPLTALFPFWKTVPMFRHTVGQYFRLFAHHIVQQQNVQHLLYLDTDVVIMSNLQHLWRQRNAQHWFQWGANMVSACILINVPRLEDVWRRYQDVDVYHVKNIMENTLDRHIADDQMILQVINVTYPDAVGLLSPEWDVSYVDGPWNNHQKNKLNEPVIPQYRSAVGMLHYNGGGASKQAYMIQHEVFRDSSKSCSWLRSLLGGKCNVHQNTLGSSWGLARYYIDLPWSQARFIAESQVQGDECYKVEMSVVDV